jgi:hypothetical protein
LEHQLVDQIVYVLASQYVLTYDGDEISSSVLDIGSILLNQIQDESMSRRVAIPLQRCSQDIDLKNLDSVWDGIGHLTASTASDTNRLVALLSQPLQESLAENLYSHTMLGIYDVIS